MTQASEWHRPVGVTILALLAGLVGLFQLYQMLIWLGIASWPANEYLGKEVAVPNAQWGPALWALLLAAIWFWVAKGFWDVRAYAWTFGTFIALFTLFYGFMVLLFGSSIELQTIPWLFATIVLFYLYYPGVREQFMQHEMSLLTPEQKAAMEQVAAANAAAAQAYAAAAAPPAAPPPAPPAAPPSSGSPTG
jgi:hypothetical protein